MPIFFVDFSFSGEAAARPILKASMISCQLLPFSNLAHLQQIYTGFNLLHKQGLIQLRQTLCREEVIDNGKAPHLRDAKRYHLKVILNGDRVIYYDLHDSFEIDREALGKVDLYFKRSYSEQEARQFNDKYKIFPLGLNCEVYSRGFDVLFLKRASLQTGVAKLRDLLIGMGLDRVVGGKLYVLRVDEVGTYPRFNLLPRVLFMARAWNPEMAKSKEKREEIESINNNRAQCIKLLRKEFGKYFLGGFAHNDYAVRRFRNCLLPDDRLSKRANYIKLLDQFPICVATAGVHGSNGWKLAEYVSRAKAIVSEKLNYRVAGYFERGANYLDFVSPEGCIEASVKLFNDYRLRCHLMMNNYEYYQCNLRPDSLVLNTLAIALFSGATDYSQIQQPNRATVVAMSS